MCPTGRIPARIPLIIMRKYRYPLMVLTAILLCFGGIGTSAEGAFQANINNTGSQFSSGVVALQDSIGSTTCQAAGSGPQTANCTTDPLPAIGASSSVGLDSTGTLSQNVGVAANSCGAQQLLDSTGSNTGFPLYGVTYQQPGPLGGYSLSFSGSRGWVETSTSINPPVFSIAGWFKTTTGGTIIGDSNAQGITGTTASDRLVWIDSTGNLVWGSSYTKNKIWKSTGTYNNGAWHFFVISLSSTITIYVDGSQLFNSHSSADTATDSYAGYWHIGWGYDTSSSGWSDNPTSPYWSGNLAGLAVFNSALTAANDTTLYGSANFTDYVNNVNSLAPASFWPMQENGTAPYTGLMPGQSSTASDICSQPLISITDGTTCVFPATGCSTPVPIADLLTQSSNTVALGSNQTTTWTIDLSENNTPTIYAGFHMIGTLAISGYNQSWSAVLLHPMNVVVQ